MVTKSIIETPFGSKFIYRIDGECVWSEYIQFDRSERLTFAKRLVAGFQNMWRLVGTAA
ncbi:MAG: hypothetical protein RIS70_2330 [Planctomycetota bacterium]|jgi:hypothetical protein